jgi:hypothetical protein
MEFAQLYGYVESIRPDFWLVPARLVAIQKGRGSAKKSSSVRCKFNDADSRALPAASSVVRLRLWGSGL